MPDLRWWPFGSGHDFAHTSGVPAVGALVAHSHAVYRVLEIHDVPEDRWDDRDREKYLRWGDNALPRYVEVVQVRPRPVDEKDSKFTLTIGGRYYGASLYVYRSEHYPVCSICDEPMPCRELHGDRILAESGRRDERYAIPGRCPSCLEIVTTRQASRTFEDNLYIPLGPPVIYHVGRAECRYSATGYEQRWVALDPENRRCVLSCPGHLTNHNDGTYECSEWALCPGPTARHDSATVCRCPDCHARGDFGCEPTKDAKLVNRTTP
ncbi:MAG: hypothetical protein ABR532_02370 [Candidatus Dormibacteria bacterium]